MKKLTKEQVKIIYIGAGGFIFLLLLWLFIYLPRSREVSVIKKELIGVEAGIKEIDALLAGRQLSKVAADLEMNFRNIKNRLPSQEESIIQNLSKTALDYRIEIKSINISDKKALKSTITGFDIEKVSITMNLVSEFKALGEYINTLRNDFPAIVEIDKISIGGKGQGKPALNINLKISSYLSKEE